MAWKDYEITFADGSKANWLQKILLAPIAFPILLATVCAVNIAQAKQAKRRKPVETIEYRNPTFDKASWGPGEWHEEPDKKQWLDAATGLPCLIVRARTSGGLCGYVGVPRTHPAYGLSYNGETQEAHDARMRHSREQIRKKNKVGEWEPFPETPETAVVPGIGEALQKIEVHGELTYSGKCEESQNDCEGICHKAPAGEDDVWWFGFDCAHYRDVMPAIRAVLKEIGSPYISIGGPEEVYRNLAYVTAEVERLAQQLKALA